ncbi:MAG: zinc-binding alcohol dehydrogenase, partial [Burkholderiaceae bacterium]
TIRGSYVAGLPALGELVELAQRVELPATPLTLRPLDSVNQSLADLAAGKVVGRIVLEPGPAA